MSIIIPFVKMHGLGNDFVIMQEKDIPNNISHSQLAKKVADRRMGIGCDQFITYMPSDDCLLMNIFNHDGSEAMACGNATRCLSRLIFQQSKKKLITLKAKDRKIYCSYHNNDNISVNMGTVSFKEDWMPESHKLWEIAKQYSIEPKEMICVDVANPHLVIFSKLLIKDQSIIGKNLQNSELFPSGVNVSFAQIKGDDIVLKVWERGAGFTHACGSGGIATFAAANKLKFVQNKSNVIFRHGKLHMEKNDSNIIMTGPAAYLFDGDFHYEE
ncbi:MAG TPA: diaminopimelate epimerase [Candidatus Megaira endosymbiont of Nemacystus decipiens]|nr:diaminopimelate epimerase [Candidatus Megaera endosymbiont of Nemacystus decipiens]